MQGTDNKNLDVIVIGSGMGGMVVAALLTLAIGPIQQE